MYCPDKLEYLLSNGRCANEADARGRTPLWYACTRSRKTSVEILLRVGATIGPDIDETSPLTIAIRKDNLEITKLLLQATNAYALQEPNGEVILMKARSLEMAKLLSEAHSPHINATDHLGR